MQRRIYWHLPDLASARRTMHDLLLARLAESHVRFVAREDTAMSGLHAAKAASGQGRIPLMTDAPRPRARRPETRLEAVEPNIPTFP